MAGQACRQLDSQWYVSGATKQNEGRQRHKAQLSVSEDQRRRRNSPVSGKRQNKRRSRVDFSGARGAPLGSAGRRVGRGLPASRTSAVRAPKNGGEDRGVMYLWRPRRRALVELTICLAAATDEWYQRADDGDIARTLALIGGLGDLPTHAPRRPSLSSCSDIRGWRVDGRKNDKKKERKPERKRLVGSSSHN